MRMREVRHVESMGRGETTGGGGDHFCNLTLSVMASLIFRCVGKIAKTDYYIHQVCLSVCLPVSKEQLRSHWAYFHEI